VKASERYAADIAAMGPEERAYLLRALSEAEENRQDALRELEDIDFERMPVSIREFLTDPELLGNTGQITDWDADDDGEQQGIYPFWRHELDDLFDPNKHFQQWIVSAAIGAGKSWCAIIAILYKIYWLLCLRNPQQFCGINQNSAITFGFFSATRDIGRATEHSMLTSIMGDSPFFKKMVGVTDKYRPYELLKLPKNIRIAFGSRAQHALGQNLLGGLMDEAAFGILTEDRQMRQLFDGFWRRLQSRYSDSVSPGLLIIASSKAAQADFLEKHIQRWATAENADSVKLTRGALYNIKPHQFRARDTFKIQIGDDIRPSRILEAGELPDPGFQVEEIPNHPALRSQYNADLEGALRDISAICVTNESPLIPLREKLISCIDESRQHPFTSETVYAGTRDTIEIKHLFIPEQVLVKRILKWVPRVNAGFSRYIHVDIGLRHDALGLAMVHLAGSQQAQTLNELGEPIVEEIPQVFVDLLLQVRCHQGDQVDLTKVTRFIMYLAQDCGYPIGGVSFDQFQSAHISQILAKLNFPVSYQSVDRTETPYLTLASIIQNEAISYYNYPVLLKELRELRRDLEKRRIDHPARSGDGTEGSKDVSDALAGAVTSALKHPHSYGLGDGMPMRDRDFVPSRNDPSNTAWVTEGRRVKVLGMPEFTARDVFGNPAIK
jgi:hypothetical protein